MLRTLMQQCCICQDGCFTAHFSHVIARTPSPSWATRHPKSRGALGRARQAPLSSIYAGAS